RPRTTMTWMHLRLGRSPRRDRRGVERLTSPPTLFPPTTSQPRPQRARRRVAAFHPLCPPPGLTAGHPLSARADPRLEPKASVSEDPQAGTPCRQSWTFTSRSGSDAREG